MCICTCTLDMHATMQVEVRTQLVGVSSLGSEDGSQVVRLGGKCLSLLSHLASPLLLLHIIKLEVGSYLQRCDYTTFSLISSQSQDSMAHEGSRQPADVFTHRDTHDHPMSCQFSLLRPLPQ